MIGQLAIHLAALLVSCLLLLAVSHLLTGHLLLPLLLLLLGLFLLFFKLLNLSFQLQLFLIKATFLLFVQSFFDVTLRLAKIIFTSSFCLILLSSRLVGFQLFFQPFQFLFQQDTFIVRMHQIQLELSNQLLALCKIILQRSNLLVFVTHAIFQFINSSSQFASIANGLGIVEFGLLKILSSFIRLGTFLFLDLFDFQQFLNRVGQLLL
mmetsp:Transcript_18466/g.45771  ORF Transcript_18466/g.45771 Transcript_18466/m.45771 type:complete len:209 (+) Transcript_18466:3229-3855(+)